MPSKLTIDILLYPETELLASVQVDVGDLHDRQSPFTYGMGGNHGTNRSWGGTTTYYSSSTGNYRGYSYSGTSSSSTTTYTSHTSQEPLIKPLIRCWLAIPHLSVPRSYFP